MDSDHDSGNSDQGPIHRRRTQGTRPPPQLRSNNSSIHRISSHNSKIDHTYRPTKDEAPYSDDDELDEDEIDDDDHNRYQQTSNYRGRGRPSQHQQLIDSSYEDTNEHQDLPRYTGPLREQDRFLPIANVAKIMKKGVPEKGKIAKDAKETIQECVSEFISFITSEASDRCLQEKRKTINGEDILAAMSTLGFDSYIEPLKIFLTKIREASKYDRTLTSGGDLSDDLHRQVVQNPTNSTTSTLLSQAPTVTKIQVQPSTTVAQVTLNSQGIPIKPSANNTNSNGLEPYGHSVRVVTCVRNDQPGENPNYIYTIQPYQ